MACRALQHRQLWWKDHTLTPASTYLSSVYPCLGNLERVDEERKLCVVDLIGASSQQSLDGGFATVVHKTNERIDTILGRPLTWD